MVNLRRVTNNINRVIETSRPNSVTERSIRRRTVKTKAQVRREEFMGVIKIMVAITILILTAIIVSFLLFADQFQIKSIAVKTADAELGTAVGELVNSQLHKKVLGIPKTNKYLWTTSNLESMVTDEFPQINSLETSITNQELVLDVTESQAAASWCHQDCLAVTADGVLFKPTNHSQLSSENSLVIKLVNGLIGNEVFGQVVINPDKLQLMKVLQDSMAKIGYVGNTIELTNEYIVFIINSAESTAQISIGKVKLPSDSVSTLESSIKDLMSVIESGTLAETLTTEEAKSFELLDLTSSDKVFYKFNPIKSEE